jgi:transcriptional regulator with XRE-family HTH domain
MAIKVKAERVREYLQENGLKLKELAKALEMSNAYLSLVMHRKRKASAEFVARLLNLTGKPFEYFLTLILSKGKNKMGVRNNDKGRSGKESRKLHCPGDAQGPRRSCL